MDGADPDSRGHYGGDFSSLAAGWAGAGVYDLWFLLPGELSGGGSGFDGISAGRGARAGVWILHHDWRPGRESFPLAGRTMGAAPWDRGECATGILFALSGVRGA